MNIKGCIFTVVLPKKCHSKKDGVENMPTTLQFQIHICPAYFCYILNWQTEIRNFHLFEWFVFISEIFLARSQFVHTVNPLLANSLREIRCFVRIVLGLQVRGEVVQ